MTRLTGLAFVLAVIAAAVVLWTVEREPRNHYEALGISPHADQAEIKKAYRALALAYHPDKNPSNSAWAQEKFIRIAAAHETLSDPDTRRDYDLAQQAQSANRGQHQRRSPHQQRQHYQQQQQQHNQQYIGVWYVIGATFELLSVQNFVYFVAYLGIGTVIIDNLLPFVAFRASLAGTRLLGIFCPCWKTHQDKLNVDRAREMARKQRAARLRQQAYLTKKSDRAAAEAYHSKLYDKRHFLAAHDPIGPGSRRLTPNVRKR